MAVHNEIHKCVGGEVYTALPAYNEIHGAIATYSSPKLGNERPYFILRIYALTCPLAAFGGSIRPYTLYAASNSLNRGLNWLPLIFCPHAHTNVILYI